jgi:hypothetical protein
MMDAILAQNHHNSKVTAQPNRNRAGTQQNVADGKRCQRRQNRIDKEIAGRIRTGSHVQQQTRNEQE